MDYVPPLCTKAPDGFHVWTDDIDTLELRPLWRCELCGFYVDRYAVEGTH
jgi:hypothetical protein